MPKLTLREKQLLNSHVTRETQRCLEVFRKYEDQRSEKNNGPLFNECVKEIVLGSPFVEFNDDLKAQLKVKR